MNYFERSARTVSEPFVVPYIKLIYLALSVLVYWFVEWRFNLGGTGYINTYATIVTSILVLLVGMKPLFVAYTGQIGAILAAVNLTDPRKTIPNAVRFHFHVVLWLVLANNLVGLMLGNIEFGKGFTDTTSMVFPNLVLLIFTAVAFGYLFDMNGVDLKKKFIAGFLILILGILAWNWVGPDSRKALTSRFDGSDCTVEGPCVVNDKHVLRLEAGKNLVINQDLFWDTSVDIRPTDPDLRCNYRDSQLFQLKQTKGSNLITIVPEPEGFRAAGITSLELVSYKGGTSAERVEQDFGVCTLKLDLTPAP